MCIIRFKNAELKITRFLLALAVVLAILLIAEINVKTIGCIGDENYSDTAANFLRNFGWEIDSGSAQEQELKIPYYFDTTYEQYNLLQIAQGFNLENYRGRIVSKYDFVVLNYPGFEGGECIHASVLIYNGTVIGGDIKNVRMDGFIRGFKKDGQGENEQNTA